MLVGSVDGRVHGNRPIDQSSGVRFGQKLSVDLVPRPVGRVTAVPLPNRLPRTELRGKIPPGNAASVPVNDAFNDLAVAPERASTARQNSAATARSGTTDHHSKQKFGTPLKHSASEPPI